MHLLVLDADGHTVADLTLPGAATLKLMDGGNDPSVPVRYLVEQTKNTTTLHRHPATGSAGGEHDPGCAFGGWPHPGLCHPYPDLAEAAS
jgi:hypothetical protein